MNLYFVSDVAYMRFMKGNKVVRAVRVYPNGIVTAIYPHSDKRLVDVEMFSDPDTNTTPTGIKRVKLKDSILLDLIDGRDIKNILKKHTPTGSGFDDTEDNRYSYYFAARGSKFNYLRAPTFHILNDLPE